MDLWPRKPAVADPEVRPETPPEKTAAELIAEALQPLSQAITEQANAQKERFEKLEQSLKRPEPAHREENQPLSVLDDENAAFAQRLTPLLARQLETEARLTRSEVKAEYIANGFGDLWNQYEKEINQIVDASALTQPDGQGGFKALRGDPQYVRNVVDMVMGRAARTAGMRFDNKSKSFFIETGGNGAEGAHAPVGDGLTDNQRKVAQRMGIPLEKIKATTSKLVFVN